MRSVLGRPCPKFIDLSGAAREVLIALFVWGPQTDGDLASKSGRGELVEFDLVECWNGWSTLTVRGLELAVTADLRNWSDQRAHQKQNGISAR